MTFICHCVSFFDKLYFRILFTSTSRAHPSQEELCLTDGSCSGV